MKHIKLILIAAFIMASSFAAYKPYKAYEITLCYTRHCNGNTYTGWARVNYSYVGSVPYINYVDLLMNMPPVPPTGCIDIGTFGCQHGSPIARKEEIIEWFFKYYTPPPPIEYNTKGVKQSSPYRVDDICTWKCKNQIKGQCVEREYTCYRVDWHYGSWGNVVIDSYSVIPCIGHTMCYEFHSSRSIETQLKEIIVGSH